MILAMSLSVAGVMLFTLFAASMIAPLVWSMGVLRANATLVELERRFGNPSTTAEVKWVRPGREGSIAGPGPTINTNNLMMAYSPVGMQLRLQGLWSPIVDMPTVCIPWEYVVCRLSSKFGFYNANIEIWGFAGGRSIHVDIKSTDRDAGKVMEQCAVASERTNLPNVELRSCD